MRQQTSQISDWMDRIRQPKYTGSHQCAPCSVLNVAIAAVLGGLLALVLIPLGAVAFAIAATLIYLRRYLIPYTPTITKWYFPDRVLRWFDEHPATPVESVDEREDIDIEQTLFDLGVITECERVDNLCLDSMFRRSWGEHIATLREKETKTADTRQLLDLDEGADHRIEERGAEAAVVLIDGNQAGQWESHAALLTDLAADNALREWSDEWTDFHVINRSRILNSLRMFTEQCTECGAPVSVGQETVESCCRSFDVVVATCDGCGSRLFEIQLVDELQQF